MQLTLSPEYVASTVQRKVWGSRGLHPIPSVKYWSYRHGTDTRLSFSLEGKTCFWNNQWVEDCLWEEKKMYSALSAGQKTPSLETIKLYSLPPSSCVQRRDFTESLQEARLEWSRSLLYVFPYEKGKNGLLNSSDICKVCFQWEVGTEESNLWIQFLKILCISATRLSFLQKQHC